MTAAAERFDLVDEEGRIVGTALRSACHGNPALVHRAVHVLVFSSRGDLFLQKRAATKDIQPGKWDTSVGGHVNLGEEPDAAARRELAEELGVTGVEPRPVYRYRWSSPVETEWIHAYRLVYDGPFRLQADELDDGRFWSLDEIVAALGTGIFTPQFEHEFPRMRQTAEARS